MSTAGEEEVAYRTSMGYFGIRASAKISRVLGLARVKGNKEELVKCKDIGVNQRKMVRLGGMSHLANNAKHVWDKVFSWGTSRRRATSTKSIAGSASLGPTQHNTGTEAGFSSGADSDDAGPFAASAARMQGGMRATNGLAVAGSTEREAVDVQKILDRLGYQGIKLHRYAATHTV